MLTLHQIRRLWQKHVLAENRRDIPGLLATLCPDPTYIFMATHQRWEGPEEVASFYQGLFDAMPDATFDLVNQYVGAEGVVEESILRGTHNGKELVGFVPKGGKVALPLTIVFPMAGDKFWGERMYFNWETLREQLG